MKTVTVVIADDETLEVFAYPEDARNFAFEWWKKELALRYSDVDTESEGFIEEVNEKVISCEENPWDDYLGIIEVEVR